MRKGLYRFVDQVQWAEKMMHGSMRFRSLAYYRDYEEQAARGDGAVGNPHDKDRAALPILLTVDEAADLLRTTRGAIYAMIERRQLPGVIRVRRRSAAMRWAEGRERTLFQRLMDPAQHTPRKEAPTLRAFAPRLWMAMRGPTGRSHAGSRRRR